MRARVYLCLPQSKMNVSSLSLSFRPVCDVEDKLGPALPLCTTSHINSNKGKKSKFIRQNGAVGPPCVFVCERAVSECMLERFRRVVNVEVALELMQIKKGWLIPFDPPVHCVNAAICLEVLTPYNSICQNE